MTEACPTCGREITKRMHGLTQKELEVAELLYKGLSDKEIAQALGIAVSTVKGRVAMIARAWGTRGRMNIILRMIDIKRNKSL